MQLKLFILFLFSCTAAPVLAGEEPYMNELKGSQVAVDSFFTVSDEKFNNPTAWALIEQNISVDNIVTFEINFDTSIYFYNTPFNCTLNFKIYIYGNPADTSEITDSVTHADINLHVRYDTVTGKSYKGIALYKFKGAHKYRLKILGITSPELSPIPAIFRVKGQIVVNRQYTFDNSSTDVTRYSVVNGNQLKLEWTVSHYPGAEMFDLEYTHVDKNSQIAATIEGYESGGDYEVPADSLNKWFRNNSTRVTTAASAYLINIPYDSGFILFRIRGVQIHHTDGLRWEGNWNYFAREASASCTLPSCPSGVVFFEGHEQNLNWQFSVSFAEEGKRKEVISYFDGSLRNRQSVTISNTDNKSVVQETIYDALGRPAASILPAPAVDSTIHYFRGFNKNTSGDPYSFADLLFSSCTTTAGELTDTTGTSKYYSSNNDFLGDYYYAKYISDAGKYPLAVTEYTTDNTGRIKAQGGVGPAFQLGSGHETNYFYGKPTQTELDRLFGLEAGNASHYLKNMVVDANGQISVSYSDAGGKTIATALAGGTPPNMHNLPSNGEGAAVQVSNELIQPGDFTRNPGDYTISASATFLAPVTGDYIFEYRIDPLVYRKLFGAAKDSAICSNCYYDLEVTVKDNCENILRTETVSAGAVFDTTCASPPAVIEDTMKVVIETIGEYYVTYTLRLSEEAMFFYDSLHLEKNTDIKELNYFLRSELSKADFYACYSNCETCFDKLGTEWEFVDMFRSLYVSDSVMFSAADSLWVVDLYDSLYANCLSIQSQCNSGNVCDEKLQMLKRDVTPGGQYALYDSSYNLLEIPINRLAMRDQIDSFTNEYGVRDSILLFSENGEDSIKIDVKDLDDSLFIQYWKDIWADSLVRLHPEYCYYLWCVANDSSFVFDRDIENWNDADSVMAKGWFDPDDYKALLDADPFFKTGANGEDLYERMEKDLQRFSRTKMRMARSDKNILEFVDMILYCKDQYNGWEACNPDSACRSRGREWFLYKTLYLNLKQKYYEEARRESENPVFAECSNCFVGDDLINSSPLGCSPPPLSDFSLVDSLGYLMYVVYKDSINGVPNNLLVKMELRNNFLIPPPPYTLDTIVFYFNKGDWFKNTEITSEQSHFRLISVECAPPDLEDFVPFTADSTCNYTCPGGVYTPYDREDISFYIEYGEPAVAPEGTPEDYGNCQFYPVFDLQLGADSSCRFFNVWVCIYDSTCAGICEPEIDYPSQCTASGDDTLYRNKERRYPEYVNPEALVNEILSSNPQQDGEEQEAVIMDECIANCEAQADYWLSVLRRCNLNSSDSLALREAFIDICSRGCEIAPPFGTSSVPPELAGDYASFEEALLDILYPDGISDSCAIELIASPYPYDRQPAYIERLIMETDYGICQKIGQHRTAYISSGFTGSFHQYLLTNFGSAYSIDSTELDDLLNACLNCNGILKEDVILPLIFDPLSQPCLGCDSVQTALAAFETKFPELEPEDDDYEILFVNFFNHRFGFALTYQQYRIFIDSCDNNEEYTAQLCNTPLTEDAEAPDNSCLQDLFFTALTNANYSYIAYIDSVRLDFREAWTTRCMNAQPRLRMDAELYEYHYTLYYYDQSGNLVKTVPPEGVALLDEEAIEELQTLRSNANPYCSNNNSMVFTGGSVQFSGGTDAPQMNVGTGPFTIEAWVFLGSYDDQGILSNNHHDGSVNKGYSLQVKDGKLNLFLGGGHVFLNFEAASPSLSGLLPLETWGHIAVQRVSSSLARMFINGNEVPLTISTTLGSFNLDHSETDPFYIGASNRGGSVSVMDDDGRLRHVRLYKRALPPVEIRQNFMNYCGNPASHEALVFWEPFTEGEWTAEGGDDLVYDRVYKTAGEKAGAADFETSANNELVPAHRLVTTYQYNSLNQVLQQYSPDGDTSWFFYDRLGRLTVSQNKEQKENESYSGSDNRFSYTKYDALGRIIEVGEKSEPEDDIRDVDLLDNEELQGWISSGTDRQITKTIYDEPVNPDLQDDNTSRKRVVASIYLENATDMEGDSTLYNYDILGNVQTLVQHVKELVAVDEENGRKRIDYEYDLVSGKVNLVSYQQGRGDQFYYKYHYDADNRVTRSYSSRDKLIWTEDASYTYYLHGPLARTELGHYKVQGVDYAYTLQGWLKGINCDSLSQELDMAGDGKAATVFANMSRDVFGFKLGYYNDDYIPIDVTNATGFATKSYTAPGSLAATGNQLFNGNISFTTLALSKINAGVTAGYSYGYDQLNRLVEMRQHATGTSSGWSNSDIITAYRESIAYDANGNILKYLRHGAADETDMDSLHYKYHRDGSGHLVNNRLNHVKDAVNGANYTVDIDDQGEDNYEYDLIGNLKKDKNDNPTQRIKNIDWTVYGKIKHIEKGDDIFTTGDIEYGYDAGGNRTYKVFTLTDVEKTFYIRDAQGNVMAVYSKKNSDPVKWNEQHLYGSSRLGMWRWDTLVPATPPVVDEEPIYDSILLGSRTYELSNHLGNVLATISDKKIGVDDNEDDETEYYIAEALSQNDYYPFGMMMPQRSYSAGNQYRYGFNGKEQDPETYGEGNIYDYGFRIYNPRLGRFLSVDPLFRSYPWYTPYQFAGNKPITSIDLDGLEEVEVTVGVAYYPKLARQAAELVKTNPNQLAAMQQQAWNKVLTKIDAIVPKYFDYKHNLNGILWDNFTSEIENDILLSDEAGEFNSLYNHDPDNYQNINPLIAKAANDLSNDHYRASMNGREFYEKFINSINEAKDPNTKAALIEERSSKSWRKIIAFQQACMQAASSFLEMYGFGRLSMGAGTSTSPSSKYFNFSSQSGGGLRFVRNTSGKIEDLTPTLERIRTGGKFPHRNDGSVFKNSEGLLPQQPKGYYREYVHPTSGTKGPGAQRIVIGQGGEQYYTPDHYKSFIQIK